MLQGGGPRDAVPCTATEQPVIFQFRDRTERGYFHIFLVNMLSAQAEERQYEEHDNHGTDQIYDTVHEGFSRSCD